MKKRIYLKDAGITHLPTDIRNPQLPTSSLTPPECEISLSLDGAYAPGFEPTLSAIVTDHTGRAHSAINGFPERSISIAIPSDDMPRVKAWFSGNYTGVGNAPSATLAKNITNAISGLLADYATACQSHNLFIAPCRFAWCAVTKDGKRSKLNEIQTSQPNPEAPLLPIISHYFTDTHLTTRVQIRNIPCKASLTIDASGATELQTSRFDSIEIYSTKQIEFRAVKSEIFGINTISIDGTPKKCWTYDHYSADEIETSKVNDNNFRCLCKIPTTYLPTDGTQLILPISSGLLANFNTATLYKEESGTKTDKEDIADSLSNNGTADKWIHIITNPLDLGYPEEDKHIHGVTLFGIFPRKDPEKITLTLHGSHHRETWHDIATTHSHIIHGLRRTPYRWWRAEITLNLRPGDTLEALTFDFNPSPS